jgi:hypothetical protein
MLMAVPFFSWMPVNASQMINAIAKVLREEGEHAIGFIICFAFMIGPLVWTAINEVFPCYPLQHSLKANVSFQALLDAPCAFNE